MPFIRLWFYNPEKDKEGLLNHVVARLDGPFCHCELQFPDQSSCTIYMGTCVVLKKRTFDTDVYTSVYVTCTHDQLHKARTFAETEYRNGTKFSTMAMSMALMPKIWPYSGQGTFCSKLCADVLQAAGLLESGLATHKVSPSALYRMFASVSSGRPTMASGVVQAIDFKLPNN